MASPIATIGTLVWIAIAYRFHQALIDAVTGGRDVTRAQEPRLYNLLENLCISRGIPMPALKVADTGALNAFASGLNDKQYAITVTQGLLDNLDDAEIEAVLGHELTHIRNGDVRMLVIAVVIAGVIGFFAEMFFRLMFNSGNLFGGRSRDRDRSSDSDSKGGGGAVIIAIVIAVALVALAWLLSVVIRFALSRSREYLADAGSVELTKNPDAMISALRKIEGRGELVGSPSAVMEMCVDNPRSGFVDLFATHPAMDKRIATLVRVAGGHDPGPLALPDYHDPASGEDATAPDDGSDQPAGTDYPPPLPGPRPAPDAGKPFLPGVPPIPGMHLFPGMPHASATGVAAPQAQDAPTSGSSPWGPAHGQAPGDPPGRPPGWRN